jgi:hypothetical protein
MGRHPDVRRRDRNQFHSQLHGRGTLVYKTIRSAASDSPWMLMLALSFLSILLAER